MLCDRKIPSRGVRPLGCATSRLSVPRAEAARVHRVASGRSTRSARRLGDTEIGFEAGLRAASPTGEGREMIGLSYRSSTREGRACRGRRVLPGGHAGGPRLSRPHPVGVRPPHRTRQARPSRFVFPPCPRALRVDRPEARGCLPAPRAEAARVHRVASGRSTRSARRLGDTEIGFEVGLRAASSTGEGREMIGWKGDEK